MKESIIDIANSISRHRELEIFSATTNNAIGRVKTKYDENDMQFWIINSEGRIVTDRDWNGNPVPNSAFHKAKPYTDDGFAVPKNTYLGGILTMFQNGTHEYKSPQGIKKIEIFNRADYDPTLEAMAENISIRLAHDTQVYTYQLISEILHLQKSLIEDKEKLEEAQNNQDKAEVERLNAEIELKVQQQNEKLAKAKSFIRKHAELRYQPILDPVQETIKRSNIFNGKLIINGGPGTGKTTSLIQRIKFLTSESIQDYVKLTKEKKEIIFDQQKSWIFFTPNELLSLFLRNSMVKEELSASTDTVKVWDAHKNSLMKEYKLTDTLTQKPFRLYRNDADKCLLPTNAQKLKKLIKSFEFFFITLQKQKLERIKDLDLSNFSWKQLGESIKRDVSSLSSDNLVSLLRLFLNMEAGYSSESKKMVEDFNGLITLSAGYILNAIKKNEDRYQTLSDLLAEQTANIEEDEDEDEEIDRELFEEEDEENRLDVDVRLNAVIKSLIRKTALKNYDATVKFTAKNRLFLEKMPEISTARNIDSIGEIAYFRKFFERLTKGIIVNMYREISPTYKKFRRAELGSKSKLWDHTILEKLVNDKNSRLHIDEHAFLIYFINTLNNLFSGNLKSEFNKANHHFINAFQDNSKAVIGIDEATDFRLMDLLCMSSFNHPGFDSVTLSGDMMQKLTKNGLNAWKDFDSFHKKTELHNLEVSYRQSNTLLALAQAIYEAVNNSKPVYRSFIDKADLEPLPLVKITEDENEKQQWLVSRILEIHKSYSFIPSIAIFLPSENDLEQFAQLLNDFDELADVGIKVRACRNGEVLGDADTIRVFSIDKIKGLEFEAAFFYNADEILKSDISLEMFYKYMYVGLSRASFYLGMTLSEKLPNELSFLLEHFDENKNWN